MAGDLPRFMLFPHTVLSDKDYRHLSLLLPGLSILQILRPPAAPDWLSSMGVGWPTITDQKTIESIELAMKGFQEFADVHGDNSALASLGLDQISRAFSESRFRIQTELKGKDGAAGDERETQLLEAAVFLEMARDLDEREIDIEAGLSRMDSLEGEFREILGLSEDEGPEDTLEAMSLPVRSDTAALSYMLPKRIESWFRLLSHTMPPTLPVLVTTAPVIEELVEWVRTGDGAAGAGVEPHHAPLATLPAMDGLATEDFLSLLSDPEASAILSSYWQELEGVILSLPAPLSHERLSRATDALQSYLRAYSSEVGFSCHGSMSIDLIVGDSLTWSSIGKRLGRVEGPEAPAERAFPAEPLKILVWRFQPVSP